MKHFVFFAFAILLAASPAFAPDAEARHQRGIDHRKAATSYACIKNTSKWHAQMQVAYKRNNSNKWEHSRWSHGAPPKKTVCVALKHAGEWREYHVYARLWGIIWAKSGFCYRAARGSGSASPGAPRYSVGDFYANYNWKKASISHGCNQRPRFTGGCPHCKHRDW